MQDPCRFLETKKNPEDMTREQIERCTSELSSDIYHICKTSKFFTGITEDIDDHIVVEFANPEIVTDAFLGLPQKDQCTIEHNTIIYGSVYIASHILGEKSFIHSCKDGRITLPPRE